MKIKFKKLKENAIVPSYKHETDSGIDFFAVEDGEVFPNSTKMVSTGIAWEPESNIPFYETHFKFLLKLEGRSGLGSRGIDVFGGVVDQDYRGEIKVVLHNSNDEIFKYKRGDRIAQGIAYTIPNVELVEVDEISTNTERGEKGFGSTGK